MNIELPSIAAGWARRAVADGRFETVEDAIAYAVDQAKLADLRQKLALAEEQGGQHSADEARAFVRDHLTSKR
jgi:Arc/MetJ-type ribon-helix-helix transcriptional regulator